MGEGERQTWKERKEEKIKLKIRLVAPPGSGKSTALSEIVDSFSSIHGKMPHLNDEGRKVPIVVSGERLYTHYDLSEKFKNEKRNNMTFQLILLENYITEQERIIKFFENNSHIIIEHTGLEAIQAFTKTYHCENSLTDYNLNFVSQQHFKTFTKLKTLEKDYAIRHIFWDIDGLICDKNMNTRKRAGEGKITADTLNRICDYTRLLALETSDKNRLVLKYREGDTQSGKIISFICCEYFKLKKETCCPHCPRSTCET